MSYKGSEESSHRVGFIRIDVNHIYTDPPQKGIPKLEEIFQKKRNIQKHEIYELKNEFLSCFTHKVSPSKMATI